MSSNARLKVYSGETVDVRWDGRLCIHVAECGRARNELFVSAREPWCQPNLVTVGDAVDVVERCPTGSLSYDRKDGGPPEQAPAANTIVVSNHGPLYVHGELEIDGAAEDMPGVRYRAALCRCGQSQNKPFCDNAHEGSGFADRGAVGESASAAAGTGGPLVVKRAPNGPLLLQGNFTIVASSGRAAFTGTKAALCRCGLSKNKPFCDGAHRAGGFVAD